MGMTLRELHVVQGAGFARCEGAPPLAEPVGPWSTGASISICLTQPRLSKAEFLGIS